MRYWDSSALVPLLVREADTDRRSRELSEDGVVVTWWGTRIECASAVNRRLRSGDLDGEGFLNALTLLDVFAESWSEVQPTDVLRERALRLLRVHPLRAPDAVQLAAALVAAADAPRTLGFASADARLVEAAQKEGFTVFD